MATITGISALNNRLGAIAAPDTRKAFMGRLAFRAVAELKHGLRASRKTGFTEASIRAGQISAQGATILGAMNAIWLDRGTKPHEIRPKTRKALRWGATAADRRLSGRPRSGANVRFATVVHHPGTRAQPFIEASVRTAAERSGIKDVVIERWNRAA